MDYRDALTGLVSHTYFQLDLRERARLADDEDGSFYLAILDLDSFRSFNESRGHLVGDQYLLWLADLIGEVLVEGDSAARFGGDEFALLLNGSNLEDISARMERLRGLIEQDQRPITVSIGIANYPRDARDPIGLLKSAEDALYLAKRGGRNLVGVSLSYEERMRKPLGGDGGE